MNIKNATKSSSNYVNSTMNNDVRKPSRVLEKVILIITLFISGLAVLLGIFSLSLNNLEIFPVPVFGILAICLLILFLYMRHVKGKKDWKVVVFCGLSLIALILLRILPEYLYGLNINGIIHRSLISGLLLISIALPSFCFTLFYFLGASPKASDLSHYPVIILPILLMLILYGIIIVRVFQNGAPNINWHMLITPYRWQDFQQETWQNNWPQWINQSIHQTGIRNYILGTLLLMLLTSIISLPIGIAVGIYITEYSRGLLANIIKVSCSVLKSMSVFILGLTAVSLVTYSSGTFLSKIFDGYFLDANGNWHLANGSFITAALIISLLVIPIIARATEEGIRSVPLNLKEGSTALGASRQHTLFHILLPWSYPNIVTGLILGCAEAAGSLATIWFISGSGEFGVSPLSPVTSLTYFIYLCRGDYNLSFRKVEGAWEYSSALILIVITVGLSITALVLKRKLSQRQREA